MSDKIKPAMEPHEWAKFLNPANRSWAPLMYHNMSKHTAAATGLYGEPFGFTHEDLKTLKAAAEELQGSATEDGVRSILVRLAALLPPADLALSGSGV